MGSDVIVIAGATHREGFLDEYEDQLRKANIPFHLEQLDPLPAGANSITMRKRIAYWRKMAQQFIDYKCLYLTDAWDVLLFASMEELISKAPLDHMLCSAERNCYPNAHLADVIEGDVPWRFANNGCISSPPDILLYWCDSAENTSEMEILDQAWFNLRLAEKSPLVRLDTITNLFYVVSATQEDGSLTVKDGRPYNSRCSTFPSFLHFSGKCPADGVRKMLEEQ